MEKMEDVLDVRLRAVPRELVEMLTARAKGRGLTFRSHLIAMMWDDVDGTKRPPIKGPKKGPKVGSTKFAPPTEQEAAEYHREKGYHFDLQNFYAYYASQAWKKANGQPVSDWRRLMVTFEQKWKAEPKPGLPAEQVKALKDLFEQQDRERGGA
jgi:hypothetical protein